MTLTYGAANQMLSINGQSTLFDEDSNLLKVPSQGRWLDLQYDSRNRLVQAGDTQYQYDAEGHRIGVDATQFVVNPHTALSQVLVRTKGNGQVTYYVYGLGLIGEETAGNYFAYHYDLRGSTVALSDHQGLVSERFQYSPFGTLVSGNRQATPFLYHGMYGVMTDDNGLYYMRARYYSPEIRRFISEDTVLGVVTQGQTLNRFAFVNGNPVTFVDPTGRLGAAAFASTAMHYIGMASTAVGALSFGYKALSMLTNPKAITYDDLVDLAVDAALMAVGAGMMKAAAFAASKLKQCQINKLNREQIEAWIDNTEDLIGIFNYAEGLFYTRHIPDRKGGEHEALEKEFKQKFQDLISGKNKDKVMAFDLVRALRALGDWSRSVNKAHTRRSDGYAKRENTQALLDEINKIMEKLGKREKVRYHNRDAPMDPMRTYDSPYDRPGP